jgi:hypothetical protein
LPLDHRPLEEIAATDLQGLVDNQVIERKTLEYKRDLPGATHMERKEFLRDVSSFANTSGGHIVYGIREQDGRPAELCGLAVTDPGAEIARLENILRDGLRPRLNAVQFGWVTVGAGRHALAIRVPISWAKPHMVVFQEDGKFQSRNSNGKYAMDIDEIRTAFTSASVIGTRAAVFRMERMQTIFQGVGLPVTLPRDCAFALHICPFAAFVDGGFVDLGVVDRDQEVLELFPPTTSRLKFDLDGLQIYPATGTSRWLTVFRNGIVELVDSVPLNNANENAIFEMDLENRIAECLPRLFSVQARLGVNPPFVVSLTLLRALGRELNVTVTNNRWGNGHSIEKDLLLIPSVRIDSYDIDARRVLRPVFDGLWLAAGWPRSMDYNDAGEWVGWLTLDR